MNDLRPKIRRAIRENKLLRFKYRNGDPRECLPIEVRKSPATNAPQLLCFQLDGKGWRLLYLEHISDLDVYGSPEDIAALVVKFSAELLAQAEALS